MNYIARMNSAGEYTYLDIHGTWVSKPQSLKNQPNRAKALQWVRSLRKFATQKEAEEERDDIKDRIGNDDKVFLTNGLIY